MLTLCFPVIISLALAAPGVSRNCYNYCNSQKPELMKGDPPLNCNCADEIDTAIAAKQLSSVTLDDTGVYFVPAELQPFEEQFASQPFVILNPAKFVPKYGIRSNREFSTKKSLLDDLMPSQSAHVEIHGRTEIISHTSIDQEWGRDTPLYLDLQIENINSHEKSAVHKSAFIDDFESTEDALVECLDYQVIHYTRKYGFIKEFKEFWEARNLNKYKQVTDVEIEEKIKEYCSKPEAIVKQSLHEIKQALPKKGRASDYAVINEKEDWKVNNTTENGKNILANITNSENSASLITVTSMSHSATVQSEAYNTSTEKYSLSENTAKTYDTTFDPTENWPFMTLINSKHSLTTNEPNKNEMPFISSPSAFLYDADSEKTVSTTENISITDHQEKQTIPVNQKKGITERSELDSDMDSMASEDVFHTFRPFTLTASTGPISENITNNLPNSSSSSNTDVPVREKSASIEDSTRESFGEEYTVTEVSTEPTLRKEYVTIDVYPEEPVRKELSETSTDASLRTEMSTTEVNLSDAQSSNINETTQILVTSSYSHVRNTYTEKDMKIPKIITKECGNNTVYSAINGIEELPNHDFADSNIAESRHSETNKNDITGKLYFYSETELVPVRFVQSDTGTISLGIDSLALCNKLVRKRNKKSQLLTNICDYIENV